MLRSCALLAVLGALTFGPAAAAKGPISLEICGAGGCVDAGKEISESIPLSDSEVALERFGPAPPLVPYYELRFDAEWFPEAGPRFYVPDAEVLKMGFNWIRVDETLAARLARAVRSLAPFPPPELTRVVVAGQAADDPSAYAGLFDVLPGAQHPVEAERIEIVLEAGSPTPWTVDEPIWYYLGNRIIRRDGELFSLPATLGDVVESDSGLAAAANTLPPRERPAAKPDVIEDDAGLAAASGSPPAQEPSATDGFPWAAVAGAAGGLLLLVLAAVVALRGAPRRPRERPS